MLVNRRNRNYFAKCAIHPRSKHSRTSAHPIKTYLDSAKWTQLTTEDKEKIGSDLIDLVGVAYANTVLGSFVKNQNDVNASNWLALKSDDQTIICAIFYRQARSTESWSGYKIQGFGHDNQPNSKYQLIIQLKKLLEQQGWWIECRAAVAKALHKIGAPLITDEKLVSSIFPNTNLKMGENGEYTRHLTTNNSSPITNETIFGNPTLKKQFDITEYITKINESSLRHINQRNEMSYVIGSNQPQLQRYISQCAGVPLLEDSKLRENYKEITEFLSSFSSTIGLINENYVYVSIQTVPITKMVSIEYFSKPEKLVKIDENAYHFDINGTIILCPKIGYIGTDVFNKVFLFSSIEKFIELETMMVLKFNDWNIKFKNFLSTQIKSDSKSIKEYIDNASNRQVLIETEDESIEDIIDNLNYNDIATAIADIVYANENNINLRCNNIINSINTHKNEILKYFLNAIKENNEDDSNFSIMLSAIDVFKILGIDWPELAVIKKSIEFEIQQTSVFENSKTFNIKEYISKLSSNKSPNWYENILYTFKNGYIEMAIDCINFAILDLGEDETDPYIDQIVKIINEHKTEILRYFLRIVKDTMAESNYHLSASIGTLKILGIIWPELDVIKKSLDTELQNRKSINENTEKLPESAVQKYIKNIGDNLKKHDIDDAICNIVYTVYLAPNTSILYKDEFTVLINFHKTEILQHLLGLLKNWDIEGSYGIISPAIRAFKILGINWPELDIIMKSYQNDRKHNTIDEDEEFNIGDNTLSKVAATNTINGIVDSLNNYHINAAISEISYVVFRGRDTTLHYRNILVDAITKRKFEILKYFLYLIKSLTSENANYTISPAIRAFKILGITWPELDIIKKSLDLENKDELLENKLSKSKIVKKLSTTATLNLSNSIIDHFHNENIGYAIDRLIILFKLGNNAIQYQSDLVNAINVKKPMVIKYFLKLLKNNPVENASYVLLPAFDIFKKLGINLPELDIIKKSLDLEV